MKHYDICTCCYLMCIDLPLVRDPTKNPHANPCYGEVFYKSYCMETRELKGFLKLEPALLVHNGPFKSKELQKGISSEAILGL